MHSESNYYEIPQAANRVLRYVPNRVRAADRVVGAELLVARAICAHSLN